MVWKRDAICHHSVKDNWLISLHKQRRCFIDFIAHCSTFTWEVSSHVCAVCSSTVGMYKNLTLWKILPCVLWWISCDLFAWVHSPCCVEHLFESWRCNLMALSKTWFDWCLEYEGRNKRLSKWEYCVWESVCVCRLNYCFAIHIFTFIYLFITYIYVCSLHCHWGCDYY